MATFLKSDENRDSRQKLSAEWSELGDTVRKVMLELAVESDPSTKILKKYSPQLVNMTHEKARLLRGELRE